MNNNEWVEFVQDVQSEMSRVVKMCEHELCVGGMTMIQQALACNIKIAAVKACDDCARELGRISVKQEMQKLQKEGWGFICSKDETGLYRVEVLDPTGQEGLGVATELMEALKCSLLSVRKMGERAKEEPEGPTTDPETSTLLPETVADYIVGQKTCGIQIGDKVRVLRKADSFAQGWEEEWAEDMNQYVGQTGEVIDINRHSGIQLAFKWWFPYFVLERVEHKKP